MKILVHRICGHPGYTKILDWTKLIIITGAAQFGIQIITLLSGILIIRQLSTNEYAFYTLANSVLGTMTVLADGGISTSILAIGGRVWQDREKLGSVFVTGLYLRKRLAIASLIVTIPILLYLLFLHHASWWMGILIALSIIPYFSTALYGTLLQIAPKLHQDIPVLQKNQLALNAGRFALLILTLFVFPYSFVAILAAGIPQIFANRHLQKISTEYTDWNQIWNPEVKKEIIGFIKKILPGSIYYCLSGQITIWLISIFGSTLAVAQIGALGRIAIIVSVFNMLFATLIYPRFAKVLNSRKLLLNRYLQIQVGVLALSFFIIAFAWVFSSQILWILGAEYADLTHELVLNIIGTCFGLIAGVSFNLSTSRGWVLNPFVMISINIVSTILGVWLFDVATINGVLIFNIFISCIQIMMYWIYTFTKIWQAG